MHSFRRRLRWLPRAPKASPRTTSSHSPGAERPTAIRDPSYLHNPRWAKIRRSARSSMFQDILRRGRAQYRRTIQDFPMEQIDSTDKRVRAVCETCCRSYWGHEHISQGSPRGDFAGQSTLFRYKGSILYVCSDAIRQSAPGYEKCYCKWREE
jgi:hypothetical protein